MGKIKGFLKKEASTQRVIFVVYILLGLWWALTGEGILFWVGLLFFLLCSSMLILDALFYRSINKKRQKFVEEFGLISKEEAARYVGITPERIVTLVECGMMLGVRIGDEWFFKGPDLMTLRENLAIFEGAEK